MPRTSSQPKYPSGTQAVWCFVDFSLCFPDNIEHYLEVNPMSDKVYKTSKGWRKYGKNHRYNDPYVKVSKIHHRKGVDNP